MKVLLTGGNGFVASRLEQFLVDKGFDVLNVSRSTSPTLFDTLNSSESFDFYIHTAGLSKDSPFSDMEPYLQTNVELTKNVFQRFQDDGSAKRFVFFSSLYALDESDKATSYARSKSLAEKYLTEFEDSRVQILRPSLICDGINARGILGPLQKLSDRGIGFSFPKGFKMSWVSIETIHETVLNTLENESYHSPLNLIDGVADLNSPNTWIKEFQTKTPKIVLPLPRFLLASLFTLGHTIKLPFNKHFYRKLQS